MRVREGRGDVREREEAGVPRQAGPGNKRTSRLWTAYRMRSALVFMFIFRRMRARYVLTVFTLRDNSPAISETDLPEAIRDKTWYSRSERPSWSGRPSSVARLKANRSARDPLRYLPPETTFLIAATNSSGTASLVR